MIVQQTLIDVTCGSCGIQFGLPDFYWQRREKDGATYYCPNGHKLSQGEKEEDRLRRQLEAERSRRVHAEDQRKAAEKTLTATKGQLTKAKKRAANGVCPCCNRSFVDVQRHMRSKHPEHVAEVGS